MTQRIGFESIGLDVSAHMTEDKDYITFRDVVIAREIVQSYNIDGEEKKAYKPADELDKAVIGKGRYHVPIVMDAHPPNIVPDSTALIHGQVEDMLFVKNLKDMKTGRPNGRGISASLVFFKSQIDEDKQNQLRGINRGDGNKDVSIGFFYTLDDVPGKWSGLDYDFVQRDICLNHLAAPIDAGRCPMPYCGIGADSIVKRLRAVDPEETEDFIHWPVKDKDDFVDDSFKTITLSKDEGIKAVIGKLKSDPDGSTVTQKYIFAKEKDWTMEKAKAWVKEHKDDALPSGDEDIPFSIVSLKLPLVREAFKAAGDMTLEEIEAKISEIKEKRDQIYKKLDEYYSKKQSDPKIEALHEELNDLYLELEAYTQAKVFKIAGDDEEDKGEGEPVKAWFEKVDWKQNVDAYDALPDDLKKQVDELGLCPECSDKDETEEFGEVKPEDAEQDPPEPDVEEAVIARKTEKSTEELIKRPDLYG